MAKRLKNSIQAAYIPSDLCLSVKDTLSFVEEADTLRKVAGPYSFELV